MTQEQTAMLGEVIMLLRTASRRIYRAGSTAPHPDEETSVRLGMLAGGAAILAQELEDMLKKPDAGPS